MWKICRASCTCTKELKSTEASCEDPPSLEEQTPFLAWAMLTWLFSHRALRAEPSPVAFHSAGGVPRALITILKPRGVETPPFHSGIPEERKSPPSEAARLPGCCCHLLPTRSLAAHGSPDLGTRQGKGGEENAGIQEFRSGLVVPRRSAWGQTQVCAVRAAPFQPGHRGCGCGRGDGEPCRGAACGRGKG